MQNNKEVVSGAVDELPPLPQPEDSPMLNNHPYFTADQMREYAIAALLASQPTAAVSDEEAITVLPDGSAFGVMSFPLPTGHWSTADGFNVPPMPLRMGTGDNRRQQFNEAVRAAGRYAVRASTMNGKESDFDPDAMVQNFVVGLLGYHTPDGLSSDEWANPQDLPDLLSHPVAPAQPTPAVSDALRAMQNLGVSLNDYDSQALETLCDFAAHALLSHPAAPAQPTPEVSEQVSTFTGSAAEIQSRLKQPLQTPRQRINQRKTLAEQKSKLLHEAIRRIREKARETPAWANAYNSAITTIELLAGEKNDD